MNEYIERETIIKKLNEIGGCDASDDFSKGWDKAVDTAIEAVEKLPTADVAPVRKGWWVNFYGTYEVAECSVCEELFEITFGEASNQEIFDEFKRTYCYCPSCGAKMDGGEKNDP